MSSRLWTVILFVIPFPAIAVYQIVPLIAEQEATLGQATMLELIPSLIRLDELATDEERTVDVKVFNRSDEVVLLKPPIAGCGCISPTLDRAELPPGQQATLQFVFRAPAKPGVTQKKIVLQTRQSGDIWELPITASVVADVWLTPSRMDVPLVREGQGVATGVVNHAEHVNVTRVTSSHPGVLTASLTKRGPKRQWFEVCANSKEDGKGELKFYAENGDEPVATLPVQWRMPRLFACHPREISVDTKRKQQQFEVAVISDSEAIAELTFEPVVDWLEIRKVEETSSRITKLILQTNSTGVPEDFQGPVVVVSGNDSRQTAEIVANLMKR